MRRIYFDNGSTSFPKAPGVGEAMKELLDHQAVNVNRGSYQEAYELGGELLEARERVAWLFDGEPGQVIFNSGITMSMNQLIKGFLKPGDQVLVTGMEHNAVMRPLEQLKGKGVQVEIVPADCQGLVHPEELERRISATTKLFIGIHASNVCGTVNPIDLFGDICHQQGIFYGIDTAQSAGTLPVSMKASHCDFLGFTGHKGLLGPQGVGGFLVSDALKDQMEPLIAGGTGSWSNLLTIPEEMPDRYESGTMNLPGIIGLSKSLEYLKETGIDRIHQRKNQLTALFLEGVRDLPGVRMIGMPDMQDRTAVVSLDFQNQDNGEIAFNLEQQYGIMTRVGLHCAPMAHKSLGTLHTGTIRFSFSHWNTEEEIDLAVNAIRDLSQI